MFAIAPGLLLILVAWSLRWFHPFCIYFIKDLSIYALYDGSLPLYVCSYKSFSFILSHFILARNKTAVDEILLYLPLYNSTAVNKVTLFTVDDNENLKRRNEKNGKNDIKYTFERRKVTWPHRSCCQQEINGWSSTNIFNKVTTTYVNTVEVIGVTTNLVLFYYWNNKYHSPICLEKWLYCSDVFRIWLADLWV